MISPEDDLSTDDPLDGLGEEEIEGKAALDDSEADAGDDVPRALQKVELDLDDAPFLEEEEEEEEEESAEVEQPEDQPEKKRVSLAALLKNRKVILGLLVLFVIILAIPIKIWLLPSDEKIVEEIKPVKETQPAETPVEPELQEYPVRFEPFWVEKEQTDGTVRFIHCQFSITTTNTAAKREIEIKMLVLRDAVFYYLSNKDFEFLADTNNMELLKKDILAVINKYLGQSQLDTLLVEKYLVQ